MYIYIYIFDFEIYQIFIILYYIKNYEGTTNAKSFKLDKPHYRVCVSFIIFDIQDYNDIMNLKVHKV